MGTPFPALSLAEASIILSFGLCVEEWNAMELYPHPSVVSFHLPPRDICQALTFQSLVMNLRALLSREPFLEHINKKEKASLIL